MAERTFGDVVRSLAGPIYVPSLLSACAGAALTPMLPLIAIQLGFSPAVAALIVGVMGLVAVLGPIPIGMAMERLGERNAMLGAAALHIAAGGVALWLLTRGATPGVRVLFVVVVGTTAIAGEIWDLGRQTTLSAELPVALRGRAMNLFGGTMRIGGVIGPTLGAAALAVAGFSGIYVLSMVLMAAAGLMVLRFLVPPPDEPPTPVEVPLEPRRGGLTPHVVKAMTMVGIGLAALIIARVNVAVLLPLAGHQLGLSPATISVIFAVGMALEVLLFFPAGLYVDRFGRGIMGGICCAGMGVGFVLLAATPWLSRHGLSVVAAFTIARVVISLGNALGSGIVKTLGADLAPTFRRAAHLGYYNSITGVGVLAGPALVSAMTAAVGLFAAGTLTGGLSLAGAVYLWLVLPRYSPGLHGRPPPFHPDRAPAQSG